MQRSAIAYALWACSAALAATFTAPVPIGAQAQEQITICHQTGSSTSPWVFMTIDARLWPEYQAQGDKRASSLADCTQTTQPPITAQVAPVTTAQQQPVAQSTAIPTPTLAPPTVAPTAVATPAATVETAGARVAQATAVAPDVSTLPKSGEPDRLVLVLGLLAIAATGLGLRRLARRGTS